MLMFVNEEKVMYRTFAAALIAIAAPLFGASGPLTLRVDVARAATDDAPVMATVALQNTSRHAVPVAAPGPDTLTTQARLDVALPGAKCSAQDVAARLGTSPRVINLEPGESATATIDLAANHPYGLPLGRNSIVVLYEGAGPGAWKGVVTSAPVEIELRAPSGSAANMYDDFVSLCHRLQQADAAAAADVLEFARRNPSFVYTRPLMFRATQIAGGPVGQSLNEFLTRAYPGTLQADVARRNIAAAQRAETEHADYGAYLAAYQVALNDPANHDAAQAKRALGTILDQDMWAAHDNFLFWIDQRI
jgi:hypothetical protein